VNFIKSLDRHTDYIVITSRHFFQNTTINSKVSVIYFLVGLEMSRL